MTQETTKSQTPQKKEAPRNSRPAVLRFSPTAWAKLLYFRDRGETEIGGFAITRPDDLLYVEEFVTVRQDTTIASISFKDEAVAEFFERQVDDGRKPEQFCRIWLHTHPGESCEPSSVDEETFRRVFGRCEWAVMFVVGKTSKTHARLRFNVGPGASIMLPVDLDYRGPFEGTDVEAWKAEYDAHIKAEPWTFLHSERSFGNVADVEAADKASPEDWLEAFESMDAAERRLVVDELANRPELWDDEFEVTMP